MQLTRTTSRGQKHAGEASGLRQSAQKNDEHRNLQGAVKQLPDWRRPHRRRRNAQTQERRSSVFIPKQKASRFIRNKTRSDTQNMTSEPETFLPDL